LYTVLRKSAVVFVVTACALALIFVGFENGTNHAQATNGARAEKPANVVGLPGYDIDVFAKGTASYSNPDSVDVAGKHVYIGYQNVTAKDGSDNKSSTVVEYTLDGKVVRTFSVPGHCDGLRFNPTTHLLWATSNEDGNPRIVTINPDNGVVTPYTFPAAPHGGGYDDVIFLNGTAFIAASNPTLDNAGINKFPAVDKIELKDGKAILTPVLLGNASALDTTTNKTVPLNLTDPDSMTVDTQGNLVLVDQADAQLIVVDDPGQSKQEVKRIPVGTQVDDTLWIRSKEGNLLVVDGKQNAIYSVTINKTDFTPGTVYTEAPADAGVAGFVGTVDLKTGTIVPVIIGLTSPTGMGFIPKENA